VLPGKPSLGETANEFGELRGQTGEQTGAPKSGDRIILFWPEGDQHLLSAGGTKGPRLHDWIARRLRAHPSGFTTLVAKQPVHKQARVQSCALLREQWTYPLLHLSQRRNIANGDLAYFTTWCPAGTSIKTLVSAICCTPGNFFATPASTCLTLPPRTGHCANVANFMSGTMTSIP
jgi:hypothetical protein